LELKLKICPNCNAENVFDGAQFCKDCGAPLSEQETGNPDIPANQDQEDSLDFVVTETQSPDTPGFLGDASDKKEPVPDSADDRLEIADPADLLSGAGPEEDLSSPVPAEDQPVKEDDLDFSSCTAGAEEDYDKPQPEVDQSINGNNLDLASFASGNNEAEQKKPEEPKPEETVPPIDWNADSQKKDVSPEKRPARPEEITARMERYKSSNEKRPLNEPIKPAKQEKPEEPQPDVSVKPIEDPALGENNTKSSQKIRGVAYFRKNLIQLAGNPFLHDGDEVVVNNKHYLLKTKRLGKKFTIGLFATVVAAVLIVIASQFINTNLSGEGEIVGMILNQNDQPYLESALVNIPSLGKSTRTNAQGFFKFELIPTGTYEIIYELGEDYIGRGNVTVTSGQTTLMSFNHLERKQYAQKKNSKPQVNTSRKAEPDNSGSASKSNNTSRSERPVEKYGKIKVQANVDNVRMDLEGQILGAGNNVYSKINTGRRRVILSKTGYKDFTTTISVEPGKTTVINATMTRLTASETAKVSEKDYISLGNDDLAAGNYIQAIQNFTKAIDYNRGSADAYEGRAKAYARNNQPDYAAMDYIRVGEITRMAGNDTRAIDAFSSALKLSSRNVSAYVGRAGTYADKGNFRSSIEDYDKALGINERFYPALYGIGVAYFKMGDSKKAEKYFDKAYDIDRSDPYLYQYMMLNYLARDNFNKMRETYAEFKAVAGPAELAEFKSSSRYEPILRLINEEDR